MLDEMFPVKCFKLILKGFDEKFIKHINLLTISEVIKIWLFSRIYLFLFQELRSNLEEAKDETKVTEEDRQYQLLVDGNRDKFKTLREIRSGATKRRIDKFENM